MLRNITRDCALFRGTTPFIFFLTRGRPNYLGVFDELPAYGKSRVRHFAARGCASLSLRRSYARLSRTSVVRPSVAFRFSAQTTRGGGRRPG